MTVLSERQQDAALAIVAAWFGRRWELPGPAPTGHDAAYHGAGPMLVRDWEGAWTAIPPTPAILLEGYYGWTDDFGADDAVASQLSAAGVIASVHTGYALTLHPVR